MNEKIQGRRPLSSRNTAWARGIARSAATWGISPNSVSMTSVFFSALAAASLFYFQTCSETLDRALLLVAVAVLIQLRLLCNLIDGMIAVEGGKKSATGDIFNELPDRISDALVLVPAGYLIPQWYGNEMGWAAALLAIFTAYVRALGVSLGTKNYFLGPMAKPHRMALMTLACLAGVIEVYRGWHGWTMTAALAVVIIGSIITIARRTGAIAGELRLR